MGIWASIVAFFESIPAFASILNFFKKTPEEKERDRLKDATQKRKEESHRTGAAFQKAKDTGGDTSGIEDIINHER